MKNFSKEYWFWALRFLLICFINGFILFLLDKINIITEKEFIIVYLYSCFIILFFSLFQIFLDKNQNNSNLNKAKDILCEERTFLWDKIPYSINEEHKKERIEFYEMIERVRKLLKKLK